MRNLWLTKSNWSSYHNSHYSYHSSQLDNYCVIPCPFMHVTISYDESMSFIFWQALSFCTSSYYVHRLNNSYHNIFLNQLIRVIEDSDGVLVQIWRILRRRNWSIGDSHWTETLLIAACEFRVQSPWMLIIGFRGSSLRMSLSGNSKFMSQLWT